jgi:hypothetical protein
MLAAVAAVTERGFVESGEAIFIDPGVSFAITLGPADDEGFVPCVVGDRLVFIHVDDLAPRVGVVRESEDGCPLLGSRVRRARRTRSFAR